MCEESAITIWWKCQCSQRRTCQHRSQHVSLSSGSKKAKRCSAREKNEATFESPVGSTRTNTGCLVFFIVSLWLQTSQSKLFNCRTCKRWHAHTFGLLTLTIGKSEALDNHHHERGTCVLFVSHNFSSRGSDGTVDNGPQLFQTGRCTTRRGPRTRDPPLKGAARCQAAILWEPDTDCEKRRVQAPYL